MKTKLAALALSFLVATGLTGCYTEFATTGDTNGGYGQSGNYNQYYYNDSTNAAYSYDTTGVSTPYTYNNYNNYNGYNGYYGGSPYGYDSWYYNNYFTPSPAWWNSDNLWLGFGWNSMGYSPFSLYGGLGFGWYNNYYSPFYSYYSPYGYSPYGYYGNYGYYPPLYYYQSSGTNVPARARNFGATRNGRDEFGGAAGAGVYGGASSLSGGSNGARASVESQGNNSAPRARASSGSASPSSSTTQTGVRSRGTSTPSSGTSTSGTREQAPQSTPQPRQRVRQENPPPPQQNPPSNVQPQRPPQNNPQPQPRQRAPQYNPPPPPQQNPAPNYQPPSYQPPAGPAPSPAPRPRAGGPGRMAYYNGTMMPPAVPTRVRFERQPANFAGTVRGEAINSAPPVREMTSFNAPARRLFSASQRSIASFHPTESGGHAAASRGGSSERGGNARARH